jgi:IrrE N-terminal-like domain
MKWVKDKTGRFAQRPHYLPEELDVECEELISTFLRERHGRAQYPVSTDDLTVLVETLVADLDLYADLSQEEGEVEGVTDFLPGKKPKVRISKRLSEDDRMANRLRTTLTHELGHVKFHAFMFEAPKSGLLFEPATPNLTNKCKRDNMLEARRSDWMEWQAGFACGAFLMPGTVVAEIVREFVRGLKDPIAQLHLSSTEGQSLITTLTERFGVSRDAARVRLLQKGILTDSVFSATLFS